VVGRRARGAAVLRQCLSARCPPACDRFSGESAGRRRRPGGTCLSSAIRRRYPNAGRDWGDVVFDGIGGTHIWRSRKALRPGGTVVAYGLTSSLRGGRWASGRSGRRHRFHGILIFGLYIAGGWLLPGRKRVVPYSIQWLKRRRPALFRQDLIALFDLLHQQKMKPLIAQRCPLAEARQAHELLGKGGVAGKIVLVRGQDPEGRQARRSAGGAADHVRARDQPEDGQGDRAADPGVAAAASGWRRQQGACATIERASLDLAACRRRGAR